MQDHAARVFAQNLRAILLAPPVRGRVMGLDPGFRSGCKVAVLDEHGSLLETEVIFPHDLHGGRGGSGGKGGKGGKGGGRGGGSTRDAARDYILHVIHALASDPKGNDDVEGVGNGSWAGFELRTVRYTMILTTAIVRNSCPKNGQRV